jgi:NADPH:quinone reductase-like Zn-dependent oxidoreductase
VISTARGAERVAAIPPTDNLAVIDLDDETLRDGVARLTGGAGVDIVLDTLGGDATGQALRTLRERGFLVRSIPSTKWPRRSDAWSRTDHSAGCFSILKRSPI